MPKLILAIGIICSGLLVCRMSWGAADSETTSELVLLQEIPSVSVASLIGESIADAPSSVTVFTQKDIRNMGISNLEELLNFVPGFQTTREIEQGLTTRIASRGRSTTLSEAVLLLINGQRLNDLYSGGVSIINRLIAVENIKQVEIIRGPGSALYGSNAFMGVINIITLTGANSVVADAGNLNAKSMAINFSKAMTQDFSLSAFVKGFADDGYPYDSVTDIFGITGSTKDPIQGWDLYTTIQYQNLSINFRYMERRLEDFLTFGTLDNYISHTTTKQTSVGIKYFLNLWENLKLNLSMGYSQGLWQDLTVNLPKDFEVAPGFNLTAPLLSGPKLNSYDADVSAGLIYKLSETNVLNAGIDYTQAAFIEATNLMSHDPLTLDYFGRIEEYGLDSDLSFTKDVVRKITGTYLQDKQNFGNAVNLTLGMRLDNYSDFGSSFNPRAALVWKTPWESTRIKWMHGQAFRAPNYMELYDKNNPIDFGNSDLKAETVKTYETSLIQEIWRLQLIATYFYNNLENLIVLGEPVDHPNNPFGVAAFENKDQLLTRGLEFEVKMKPIKDIYIYGTFTHFIDGNHLLVSPNFASLAINYQIEPINLNLNGIYRDKMELLPDQAAYFILNAAIKYNLFSGFDLKADVKNLLDNKYKTINTYFPEGIINRGRMFTLGFLYQF